MLTDLSNFASVKQLTRIVMARPIKETPVLRGNDAKRFDYMMSIAQPETKEVKEKIREAYEKFKEIADFPM